jgi:crotonobetainyl-CoA:carnitine CoA-transferase CaiB-like acyl-CoA transferase
VIEASGGALRPLDGLLVADLSRVVAGPLVGMILGDLGADVIKVERPGQGDDTRSWGPPWLPATDDRPPESTYSLAVNRNKRSMTLAFDVAADQLLARELINRADVVIENFTPGTLERFGLGHELVRQGHPGLIWCTIAGFGETEAAGRLPGYDLLAQAASGLMDITGEPDGRPTKVGVAVVDELSALYATIGVLAALEHRRRTGEGQRVSVSLFDTALASLLNQGASQLLAGVTPRRAGNDHPSISPYSTYRAADRDLVIACGTDIQFIKLCGVLELDLDGDDRFATNANRVARRVELDGILTSALARSSASEWAGRLATVGVPAGVVNTVAEAYEMAERLGLEPITITLREDGTRLPTARSPIRLDGTPINRATAPPRLGDDDAELRGWLLGGRG